MTDNTTELDFGTTAQKATDAEKWLKTNPGKDIATMRDYRNYLIESKAA